MRQGHATRRLARAKAARLIEQHRNSATFVSSSLQAREARMATALRDIGWKVVLVCNDPGPTADRHFDVIVEAANSGDLYTTARELQPRVCHVFFDPAEDFVVRLCRDKPGPVVLDPRRVAAPSLLKTSQIEPVRECLALADGLCARDLQAKVAERADGFRLPRRVILVPNLGWRHAATESERNVRNTTEPADVRVVCLGGLELSVAKLLAEQGIHLHVYPAPPNDDGSRPLNTDFRSEIAGLLEFQARSAYVHVHEPLPVDAVARELQLYDFAIVGARIGQSSGDVSEAYLRAFCPEHIFAYADANLPVLVDREMAFTGWLLRRYGLSVDLSKAMRPGFREALLQIKRDRTGAESCDNASRIADCTRQAERLAAFYADIIKRDETTTVRLPLWMQAARKIPGLSRSFREVGDAVSAVNQHNRALRRSEDELVATQKAHDKQLQHSKSLIGELRDQLSTLTAERNQLRSFGGRLQTEFVEMEAALGERISELTSQIDALESGAQRLREEIKLEATRINQVAGLLNWPEISIDLERWNGFDELLRLMRLAVTGLGPAATGHISSAWNIINRKNLDQLLRDGYRNFKRTLALNYFTFAVQANDPQIVALEAKLNSVEIEHCRKLAKRLPADPAFPLADQVHYRYLVMLLWTYALGQDPLGCLSRLKEPTEGNPMLVPVGEHQATQDLANSVLEYYSMREGVNFERCKRVLEIGAGYGRDAYVIASLHPQIQYVIVDIPPALYVAQRYLSSVFKDRKIFRAAAFTDFDEVREEMASASLVFLLPHQMEKLPAGWVDLTLSISSFGEMITSQIHQYFKEIGRVTSGHLYTKQWHRSQNPFDGLTLTEADYPVQQKWQKIYSRSCPVQKDFFEAMYRI